MVTPDDRKLLLEPALKKPESGRPAALRQCVRTGSPPPLIISVAPSQDILSIIQRYIRSTKIYHILYQDTQLLGLSSPMSSHRLSSSSHHPSALHRMVSVITLLMTLIIHMDYKYYILLYQDTQLLVRLSHRLSSSSRSSVRLSFAGYIMHYLYKYILYLISGILIS